MNTQVIAISEQDSINSILNANRIVSEKIKEAIKAMGLSACQARCLSCNKCAHHAGK